MGHVHGPWHVYCVELVFVFLQYMFNLIFASRYAKTVRNKNFKEDKTVRDWHNFAHRYVNYYYSGTIWITANSVKPGIYITPDVQENFCHQKKRTFDVKTYNNLIHSYFRSSIVIVNRVPTTLRMGVRNEIIIHVKILPTSEMRIIEESN